MTKNKLLLLLFFCLVFNQLEAKSMLLSEAVKKKLISLSVSAVDKVRDNAPSTYWGACINMKIVNLSSMPISVELEPGMFLMPDDSTTQRLMILDNRVLAIAAKATKKTFVNAACSQMFKGAPDADLAFHPSGKASGSLLDLAKLIAVKSYHSYAAQNAVWALTDNNDIESIYSPDKAEMDTLRKFVAKAKNIAFKPYNTVIRVEQKITNGTFKFSFPNKQGGLYTVLLFDSNGNQVQEFTKDYDYPHLDKITVTYRFQSLMNAGTYFVRLVRNRNEIVLNQPVIVN